jgi:glycosyltransferase involved in cell wall biosynthesis
VPEGPRRERHQRRYARLVRRLDGIVCVSTLLELHWSSHARAPLLRVPILADVAGMQPAQAPPAAPRIVYAGNLAHREEVRALLDAFADVAKQNADATLQVLGDDYKGESLAGARVHARALGCDARVEFAGAVDRTAAARAIAAAAVLALPRPRTPWAEAGLSAKLADYLATARPVVVTAIGDVPLYLEHGVSAFVVEPGDRAAFASALAEALADPLRAGAIGRRGREVALREFDARAHGPRLAAFFASLR